MSRRWTRTQIVLVVLVIALVAAVAHFGGGNLVRRLSDHLHGGGR
ncbi:MAG: hypothetical protein SGI84_06570 [Gemmatimonadota bacterium]|nr:hypothetical protein [Gemmatimonadota bacterium]